MDVEEFAATRNKRLVSADEDMRPFVRKALEDFGNDKTWDDVVEAAAVLWLEIFQGEAPDAFPDKVLADFQDDLRASLAKTASPANPPDEVQVDRVTLWIGTYVVNAATFHGNRAAGQRTMRWVTMHDASVRHTHVLADGQVVSVNGTFEVGGYHLHFPGEPVGPPDIWINCRCLVAGGKVKAMSAITAAAPTQEDPNIEEEGDGIHVDDAPADENEDLVDDAVEVPWHAVLAPEGVPTGDGRQFAVGALSTREMPLPISFQRTSSEGHGGSVVVARMDEAWRGEDGMWRARGVFSQSVPEAQDVIAGITEGIYRGLSVDVDDIEIQVQEEPSGDDEADLADLIFGPELTVFSKARIAGATIVSIPAFQEAYIALGPDFEDDQALAACGCNQDTVTEEALAEILDELANWPVEELEGDDAWRANFDFENQLAEIDEGAWDGSAGKYDNDQWYNATIIHTNGDSRVKSDNKLPIKTPSGKLSRAGVHAAAARLNQTDASPEQISKAKASLRTAYKTLGEEPPEAITASAFAPGTHDGPGWITNPRATERLRRYWTRGKGAAKIRWGVPGDFNRCRKQLAKYVQNPEWLAGLCANMHKEAIGVWPGQEAGGRKGHHSTETAPALSLVASAAAPVLDSTWFQDPKFSGPTGITIDDDGRITGHVAAWGVCHIGIPGICRTAPHSATNYAYFATGTVRTDAGDVRVGQITMGTGHAPGDMVGMAAASHYDNTGSAVADVAIGEDEFGIWIAGAMRPKATPEQIHDLRASGRLSGDWRRMGGSMELIAALVVNSGGFPIPVNSLAASGGVQISLVAAGMVDSMGASSYQKLNDDERVAAISRNAVAEYIHQTKREERLAAVAPAKKALRDRRIAAVRQRIKIEE
jgi:hypothetical protein